MNNLFQFSTLCDGSVISTTNRINRPQMDDDLLNCLISRAICSIKLFPLSSGLLTPDYCMPAVWPNKFHINFLDISPTFLFRRGKLLCTQKKEHIANKINDVHKST